MEKFKAFDDKRAVAHKFAHVKAFEDSGPSRTPERVMRRSPSQKLEQFDDFKRRRFLGVGACGRRPLESADPGLRPGLEACGAV